jgi:hypothetical protein
MGEFLAIFSNTSMPSKDLLFFSELYRFLGLDLTTSYASAIGSTEDTEGEEREGPGRAESTLTAPVGGAVPSVYAELLPR